uniref:CSON013450 protein n=1 Tax=Culicoides sonorensis TaxID=179676 RepID=A0A336KSR9_CULSO
MTEMIFENLFINISVLAFTVICLFHIWQIRSRSYKLALKIPGPRPLPIIGNAHLIFKITSKTDVISKALEYGKIYNPVGRAFLGYNVFVFLTHPDDIEVIILNSNQHLEKSEEYRFFEPWLGNGLLISKGEKWRSHRKLIAPTFHTNILKNFVKIFHKNSLDIVGAMRSKVGKEIDIHKFMSEVTTNILLETAMGYDKTNDKGKSGLDYAVAVMEMCDLIHLRHYQFWYRIELLFNLFGLKKKQNNLLRRIHGLTNRVIKAKQKTFQANIKEGKLPQPLFHEIISNNKAHYDSHLLKDDLDIIDESDVGERRRLAFLDLMIETAYLGADITDEEIKEEVDTIMFEGHDTTAAAASFVLCLLGEHQEIQDKVYLELQSIFSDNLRRPITYSDTIEMKYLERVILESLRLYPPVPAIARKVNEDVQLASSDLIIPSGSTVVIGTFKLHRQSEFYENPNKFNPDNFLPENTQKRKYFAYIPFSAGPRSCVGRKYAMLKLKVLLSTILKEYYVKSSVREADYSLTADIILKRGDLFRIELESRI